MEKSVFGNTACREDSVLVVRVVHVQRLDWWRARLRTHGSSSAITETPKLVFVIKHDSFAPSVDS